MSRLHDRSTIGNFTFSEKLEIKRIEKLCDKAVLDELGNIMNGHDYLWSIISQLLLDRYDRQLLRIEHFESGNILYEWNVLCDERITWKYEGRPSSRSFKFNRACLINLRIIPTQAGLGPEGCKLTRMTIVPALKEFDLQMQVSDSEPLEVEEDASEDSGMRREEYRRRYGCFYIDGPEFRVEYIHDRVED